MEEEAEPEGARYKFEERNDRQLRYFAGQPGNYVGLGVTSYEGTHKTSYYAHASITKRGGDARQQDAIKSSFGSEVGIAIADTEADPPVP